MLFIVTSTLQTRGWVIYVYTVRGKRANIPEGHEDISRCLDLYSILGRRLYAEPESLRALCALSIDAGWNRNKRGEDERVQ